MCYRIGFLLVLLCPVPAGCVTEHRNARGVISGSPQESWAERLAATTAPWQHSWNQLTGAKKETPPLVWDWSSAIPNGLPRADALRPIIPAELAATLVPNACGLAVVRASTASAPAAVQVTEVAGSVVRNCAQLHAAAERAMGSDKTLLVRLADSAADPSQASAPVEVRPETLAALDHAAAPEQRVLRVSEDGNPWIIVREGGARCKLSARIERPRALLHLIVGTQVCWGPQRMLPAEIRAACDGQPLRCLTAAETLEQLYGRPCDQTGNAAEAGLSFAAVSERDDYLITTNYKRLERQVAQAGHPSLMPPPVPALATVNNRAYPGPAILGDARALTSLLLQRHLCSAGEPERLGWLCFAASSLRTGQTIELTVDLGSGPARYGFLVPIP